MFAISGQAKDIRKVVQESEFPNATLNPVPKLSQQKTITRILRRALCVSQQGQNLAGVISSKRCFTEQTLRFSIKTSFEHIWGCSGERKVDPVVKECLSMQERDDIPQEEPAEEGFTTCLPDKKRKHGALGPGSGGAALSSR